MTALSRLPRTPHPTPAKVPHSPLRRHARGVTLIEMMIALGFGLVLILATLSIYMANRQTFRQVESLSRLNENARIAFELLGRDFRETGATPCGNNYAILADGTPDDSLPSNVLKDQSFIDWGQKTAPIRTGITAYGKTQALPNKAFGTAAAERISGTDAVMLVTTLPDTGLRVDCSSNAPCNKTLDYNTATNHDFQVSKASHGLKSGDIALMCNSRFATIFQVVGATDGNKIITHGTQAVTALPGQSSGGNCKSYLNIKNTQFDCGTTEPASAANATLSTIDQATIVKVDAYYWYVGANGRGGRSLYRITRSTNTPEEMVEGVTGMEIEYLVADAVEADPFDYVISTDYNTSTGTTPRPKGSTSSTAYTWWPNNFNIIAARVNLTLQTTELVGTNGQAISRQVSTVFNLRNPI